MTEIDIEELRTWIGRSETRSDVITERAVAALSATLDYALPQARAGQPLPPTWHWLFFLTMPAASALMPDGHAQRGGLLPPVPLPRRMWAGSDIRFEQPVIVGDKYERTSTVADVVRKEGASGPLVFVTVQHTIASGNIVAIEELQTLVFREAQSGVGPAAPKTTAAVAQWSRQIQPDPVLLFRYSALTLNSHRIHFDRDYATKEEGYEGVVVQGPLTATLLLDLLYRNAPDADVRRFSFRALQPLIAGETIQLEGCLEERAGKLWALDATGALAMDAQLQLG